MSSFLDANLNPFCGSFLGGFGLGQQYASLDDREVPAIEKPIKPLDPVERAQVLWQSYSAGGWLPGFDQAPPPSDLIWWQMRRYPTIVLAHAITTAPILAGIRTIEIADDGGNKALAEEIQAAARSDLLPMLDLVMEGALECLNFGYWLYGIEWGMKGRGKGQRKVPFKAHSLQPGEAILYRNAQWEFTGYQIGSEYRDARYAFISVNQAHINPITGYSRNANCREEWWRARQSDLNADKTEKKPSSVQMMIGVPQGQTFVDDKGEAVFPKAMAQTITNAAVQGQTFVVPLTPFTRQAIEHNPALANVPAIKVDRFDWGNIGPALEAHLKRLDSLKTDIMRAWRRPEREAMQGSHGTLAEAGAHGAIGTTDTELVHAKVCQQWDQQILERWKVQNFAGAEDIRIYTKPAPLSDPQQQFLQEVWKLLIQGQTTAPEATRLVNLRSLAEKTEMPVLSEQEVTAKKKLEQQEAADAMKAQQDAMAATKGAAGDGAPADGQQKPVNGNGNGKAKPPELAGAGRMNGS